MVTCVPTHSASTVHASGLLAGLCAGLFCLALNACDTPKPVQSEPAKQAEQAEPKAAATKPDAQPDSKQTCRDYRDLDTSKLPPLPETPHTQTLELVWNTVLTKHFDPTIACLDWPAIRVEYGTKLVDAHTPAQAYKLMNEMLGKLGQSHFWVSRHDAQGPAPKGPASAPLHVRWIEDTATVVNNAVDGYTSGVPMGAEIRSIDGVAITTMVASAAARAKGPTTFAHALDRELQMALRGPERQTTKVVYRAYGSDTDATADVTCQLPKVERLSVGNLTDLPTRIESKMLPGGKKIGYLAFNFWMLPMVADVEKRLADLRAAGAQALLIDLRGNPGGVGAMSVPIARMMLPEGGSLGTLKFRDFEQTFNVAKNPAAFAGPIALVVDEGTASTSEIFAAGMRDLGRVKIVGGGPSAGAALPSLIQQLDGGAMLQYVVGDYHSSKGAVAEGDGVAPDIRIQETREAFAKGSDPVLEGAVRHLEEAIEK